MSTVHSCPLCDFSRDTEHPTVLDPRCPGCGGVLRSSTSEPAAGPATVSPRLAAVARSRRFDTLVTALVVLPIVLAAAKIGAGAAGLAGALGALAIASLASFVALAPKR